MKTERLGHSIPFALLVMLSLIAFVFAWVTYSELQSELGSLVAYQLSATEMDSLEQAVRTYFQAAVVPLAVVIGAWVVAARVFMRAAQKERDPGE